MRRKFILWIKYQKICMFDYVKVATGRFSVEELV